MENIVIYNSSMENLLSSAGYKLGYKVSCRYLSNVCMAACWYSGLNVITVRYADNIVKSIVLCNENVKMSFRNTTFAETINKIKEFVTKEASFPPSLLHVFTDVLFSDYEANPTKLDRILDALPKMDPEFVAIFQNEIDAITSDNTAVTIAPKQFEFYRRKSNDSLCYISEAYDTTVLLYNIKDIARNISILDLRELRDQYEPVPTPTEPAELVKELLAMLSEVTDTRKLVPILQLLGCESTSELYSVFCPLTFPDVPVPICINARDDIERDIMLLQDGWCLTVNCYTILGYVNIKIEEYIVSSLGTVSSIKELIKPSEFLNFVTKFISNLLTAANFVLDSIPDVRTYLYTLLQALDKVSAPAVPWDTDWVDLEAGDFDPVAYLETTYQIDVSKLPTASINNCKNAEDCDLLYNEVRYLLTLD